MKFEEALVNLIQGKRIRSVNWEEKSFIEIKDNKILDEDGDETHLAINLNIDWELYEENKQKCSKPEIGLFGCEIKNRVLNNLLGQRDERLEELEERIRLLEEK